MSDSSSEEEDEEMPDIEETKLEETSPVTGEKLVPQQVTMASNSAKLEPLPGTVPSSAGETDLAVAEELVGGKVQSKYAEQQSKDTKDAKNAGDNNVQVPPLEVGRTNQLLRAKSVMNRRGSIQGAELGMQPSHQAWKRVLQKTPPGGVKLSARDHKNVLISYWEFDQDHLRARSDENPDGPKSPGKGGIPVADLEPFLQETLNTTMVEKEQSQREFSAMSEQKRREFKKKQQGVMWKANTCRWFHLPGCSHLAVDVFAKIYKLDTSVAAACKNVAGKPICSWYQCDDSSFDHLFVAAHYIQKADQEATDGISGFIYEQVFMVYYPALNTIISIDANGEKTWDGVTDLLCNECGFVRTNEDASVLIYKLLDSMIDEVYPLLDLYGDLLEALEFKTMASDEPTDEHVRTSFKLKRRVHSLRRYAWGMRQLLQELRQNNFGVISKDTIKMMTSVERNAENMVEVACAYMEQCTGIESFYDSFQEKVQGSTLYILTISSVTIMPFQLLTGLFGMNFVGEDEEQDQMKELHWKHGYQMFWIVGAFVTCLILFILHRKGVLKSRSISWTNAIDTKDEQDRLNKVMGEKSSDGES